MTGLCRGALPVRIHCRTAPRATECHSRLTRAMASGSDRPDILRDGYYPALNSLAETDRNDDTDIAVGHDFTEMFMIDYLLCECLNPGCFDFKNDLILFQNDFLE